MKTIMIIGAGKTQVPLIEAAKKENYHTIVCDIDSNAPGVILADEYCNISTKDRNGLMRIACDRHIDGIVANSEYAMCDVAYISSKLGLIGNPEDSIAILSSKSRFRKLQKSIGLFAPDFVSCDSLGQVDMSTFNFPVIIKPDASSGSRSVTVAKDADDAIIKLKSAMKASRNGKAIIEEYIPMPSRSVIEGEIFINHGEIIWDGLFQTIRSAEASMLPMTYIFPLSETEGIDAVKDALTKVFLITGIIHGEYNVEMYIMSNGDPFIIEINPRQGGYELPRLVRDHCGIDYYRLLVTTSMGDEEYWKSVKTFKRKNRLLIHHMLFPRGAGRFRGIQISEDLKYMVYQYRTDVEVNDMLEDTIDAASCIGYVDMEFNNIIDQLQVSSRIEKMITVEVEHKE